MSPSIHLHGLELEADTAFRLNVSALVMLGDALNETTTFADYELVAGFLHTTMLDAVTLMGASIADLVRFTGLDADVVLDVVGQGFQPWTPGGNL